MKCSVLGSVALVLVNSTLAAAVAIMPQTSNVLNSRQDLSQTPDQIAKELQSMGKDLDLSSTKVSGIDTPQCLWDATGPGGIGAVNFYVQIPNWQATFDQAKAVSDLKGSLGKNTACASGEKVFFQWDIIGNAPTGGPGVNTTLAATVFTSSFCTAWQMTNVIHATTGLPGIACEHASSDHVPDGPKPDTPDPTDGSDGYEPPEVGADPEKKKRSLTLDESHTVWIVGKPDSNSPAPSNT